MGNFKLNFKMRNLIFQKLGKLSISIRQLGAQFKNKKSTMLENWAVPGCTRWSKMVPGGTRLRQVVPDETFFGKIGISQKVGLLLRIRQLGANFFWQIKVN